MNGIFDSSSLKASIKPQMPCPGMPATYGIPYSLRMRAMTCPPLSLGMECPSGREVLDWRSHRRATAVVLSVTPTDHVWLVPNCAVGQKWPAHSAPPPGSAASLDLES